MNTRSIVAKSLVGVTLALAATAPTAMAGAASASIPDGAYTAQVYAPLPAAMWLPPLSAPATVRDNTLVIAGMTGTLIPTPDGYRATLAGHTLTLISTSDDSGAYLISDSRGATLGQLITR